MAAAWKMDHVWNLKDQGWPHAGKPIMCQADNSILDISLYDMEFLDREIVIPTSMP